MNQENIKSQSNSSIVDKERTIDHFISVLEADPKLIMITILLIDSFNLF